MYRCENWTIKKVEHQRIDVFELWCWRRLLRVPWTARRSNQSFLKEISPEFHWKDWCWSWNSNTLTTWCEELTHWKKLWCWERLKPGGEGSDRGWDDRMALGVRDGQLSFVCCSPWGHKELDMTEGLNWTELVSGGQRIGASASTSVLPMIIQDWFPLGLTGWISLQSKGLSRVFSNTTVQKHQFFGAQLSLWSNSHIHTWLLEKP